ncbi:MAG: ATP-dependent DNA helicase UvrD2 [Acidimicrobiales bacterium]
MCDPTVLGRSVVVGPGQAAPERWAACRRVPVGAVGAAAADEVGRAWREREPLVIELVPGLGLDDPDVPPAEAVSGLAPWEWTVDLDLVGERLHHAVWANAVDGRGDGSARRWRWADSAVALGATGPEGGGAGADVVLPDGVDALCDGGPLEAGLAERAGMAVVHRIWLEHGVLAPIGTNRPDGVALADDQLGAVSSPGAGARIIAPAGSGKTRVLTERARLLRRGWGLPAGAMALVAYNVRAAGEMTTRLADVGDVRIRTLNALALRLCGRTSTIEEVEVRRILGGLVSFPRRAETDPAAPWIEALSRVRLALAAPEAVEAAVADVSDLDRVARAYRSELAGRGVVDFDEQVTGAVARLLADPPFRWQMQRFARVLLVDEFQDLTPAHLLLIRLLCGPAGSVFAVGDDDQTIYGYAGATPRWLVEFDRWFPGAGLRSLEVNYRCPAPVVVAAANLLTRNGLRVAKQIRAAPGLEGGPVGRSDGLTVRTGPGGPATRTAERVAELLAEGASAEEVAVLSRVNATLAPVQVLLHNRDIAVDGGVGGRFLQRGGVRAALAWLTVAGAVDGELPGPVLAEAARRPKRGMSASLLDLVSRKRSVADLRDLAEWLEAKGSEREAGKVGDLAGDLTRVRRVAARGSTADVLAVVRTEIGDGGLDASATALDTWSSGVGSAHGDDLDALSELADLERDPGRFGAWLAEQVSVPAQRGGVTLASVHAVKGREWPHVVVHHATAGLLPHRLAEDVEEERRIFHVALTRCRWTATIVPGIPISPFVEELDEPGVPAPPAAATPVSERRAGAGSAGRSGTRAAATPAAAALPAAVGAAFVHGGHDHEILEVTADGVRSRVGGGPATMTVTFGTEVRQGDEPVVLVQPRFAEALDALRAWRTERAAGKPAYVVFDDKTLWRIAALLPTHEAGLLAISGIGPVKLENYGDDLLALAERLRTS